MKRPDIFAVLLLLIIASCNTRELKSQEKKLRGHLPEAGVVHPSVQSLGNPQCSYALYLPSELSPGKRLPLLLAFDPHGDGTIPVEKYRDLAEKYNFILMSSNDSRNGLPIEQVEVILQCLFTEIIDRYPVDTSGIYLTGFSGGSRIASLTAMYRGRIKGVTGCGAGFPAINRPALYHFNYFGMVGDTDFNLTEMMALRERLKSESTPFFIGTFPGGHAWPPLKYMETAILWQLMNRKGGSQSLPDSLRALLSERLEEMETYIRYLDANPSLMKREQTEQEALVQAMNDSDLKWWQKKIESYRTRIKSGVTDDSLSAKRLLSYTSLLCYSSAVSALGSGNREMVKKVVQIYEMADPENPVIPEIRKKMAEWN